MSNFTREQMTQMFDDHWMAVSPSIRKTAVTTIVDNLGDDYLDAIKKAVEAHGEREWLHEEPFTAKVSYGVDDDGEELFFYDTFHHGGGMGIRNLLRGAGIKDEHLPAFDAYYGEGTDVRNWDDVYVQALEAAAGTRGF